MQPHRLLMAEHQTILHMTTDIGRRVARFRESGQVDLVYVDTSTDFIHSYADRCHHGKEQGILFRDAAKKDLDPKLAQLMDQLTQEHAWARTLTERLVAANQAYREGESGALERVLTALKNIASFYPAHITKEESRFFGPCMEFFTESAQEAMLVEFAEFDRNLIHEKYQRIVEDLARESLD